MKFRIEPQQLGNRVCEIVFFSCTDWSGYSRTRCFAKWPVPFPARIYPFRDSQKEIDQESLGGFRSKLFSSYQGGSG
jgi:hypothetical protein